MADLEPPPILKFQTHPTVPHFFKRVTHITDDDSPVTESITITDLAFFSVFKRRFRPRTVLIEWQTLAAVRTYKSI